MYTLSMQSSKPQGWRKGYLNEFEKLLNNKSFRADIEDFRVKPHKEEELLSRIFREYEISPILYKFIKHYIKTDEQRIELLEPAVGIISDFEEVAYPAVSEDAKIAYKIYKQTLLIGNKELKIVFSHDTTQAEIIETIRYYRKEIEKMRVDSIRGEKLPERKRGKQKMARDNEILNLSKKGLKPREIAPIINKKFNATLTGPDISKIKNKNK